MMIEKTPQQRKFPRVGLKVPVKYQLRGYSGIDNTLSEDISIQGLRILNERYMAPQTPLDLQINLPARMIRATGKIAWSSVLPRSDRHHVGIEFVEVDPNERVYLANYIKGYIRKG